MNVLRFLVPALAAAALAACAPHGGGDDHGHDHGPGADHAHDDDHGHAHDGDTADHAHDGDTADHAHDDDHGHAHDGDADHSHADDHDHGDDHAHAEDEDAFAVTAWGFSFEIFAECDLPAAGQTAVSATHVTVLDGFQPLRSGTVTAILRGGGPPQEFTQTAPLRDGIYRVEITPAAAGDYDLSFRVETAAASEEIPAGRVRVGTAAAPGGLIAGGPAEEGEVSFLKEQQWKTEFATTPVSLGALRESVTGPGRVRAAADGEVVLSAPLDGQIPADAVLHVGQTVRAGAPVLALAPQAGAGVGAAELQSDLAVARARLERLEELLRVEAASQAEVEAARAKVAALEPLAAAASSGLRSPFDGVVAEVFVVPGQSVAAGDPVARVVRTEPLWIEVDLPPASASRLGEGSGGLIVRADASQAPLEIPAGNVTSVARGPAVDSRTGTVPALFEVRGASLVVGQAVEVEVLLPAERSGVVVPASAVVDDGGVPVVFVQADGESFARKEIRVLARQGERVLAEGLRPGSRLVTVGGAAIRRASLLSSGGAGHGHVH